MEMANCRRCRKLFPRINEPICEACKKADEDQFLAVKEFLRENPKSTILVISEVTGASHKRITQWLREGRLEIHEGGGDLRCRNCNRGINSGVYCDTCLIEVNQAIDGMFSGGKGKVHGDLSSQGRSIGMHTRGAKKE